jgi:thymidine kinase
MTNYKSWPQLTASIPIIECNFCYVDEAANITKEQINEFQRIIDRIDADIMLYGNAYIEIPKRFKSWKERYGSD